MYGHCSDDDSEVNIGDIIVIPGISKGMGSNVRLSGAARYAQITRRGKENGTGFRNGCQIHCEKQLPMPQSALESRFIVFSSRPTLVITL